MGYRTETARRPDGERRTRRGPEGDGCGSTSEDREDDEDYEGYMSQASRLLAYSLPGRLAVWPSGRLAVWPSRRLRPAASPRLPREPVAPWIASVVDAVVHRRLIDSVTPGEVAW